jgi:drug/metabolite transporter (DMT)-like permease
MTSGTQTLQHIRQPGAFDYFKLTILGCLWSSAFLCVEIALQNFSPLVIANWRIVIATLTLLPIVWFFKEKWPRSMHVWTLLTGAGFLYNAIPFTLISWGQQSISSGMAALLMSSGPFVALLLAHVFTADEKFSVIKLIGICIGFSGVALLLGAEAFSGSVQTLTGQLAMIAAVSCYVLSSLVIRRIQGVTPLMISMTVLATSSVYMLPLVFLIAEPLPPITNQWSVVALVFLGVFPTAAAYIIRVQMLQQVGTTFMAQVSYLIPPFGLFWGWLFLDQVPASTTWIALLLILAGLAVTSTKYARRSA